MSLRLASSNPRLGIGCVPHWSVKHHVSNMILQVASCCTLVVCHVAMIDMGVLLSVYAHVCMSVHCTALLHLQKKQFWGRQLSNTCGRCNTSCTTDGKNSVDVLQDLAQQSKRFQEQLQQKGDLVTGLESQLARAQKAHKVGLLTVIALMLLLNLVDKWPA